MVNRRKEARFQINIPVQVWGLDESSAPFNQYANATDISYSGALLSNMRAVRPGDLIFVRYGSKQARFRIVWTRDTEAAGRKVAIHKLNAEVCPWSEHLPEVHDEQSNDNPLKTELNEETAEVQTGRCRDCPYGNVRRWERCNVDVPVRLIIHKKDKTRLIDGRGTALNEGGMAVTAGVELSIGDELEVEFTPAYSTGPLRIPCAVRNRTGYRYGVEFSAASDTEKEQRERFRQMLSSLSSGSAKAAQLGS